MGGVKRAMMEAEDSNLRGSSGLVAMSGGFLDVRIDGNTICTVSVPIPNFMADRYSDSVSEWDEEFHDNDGNTYLATVYSSMSGVDWEVNIESDANGLQISNEIFHDISLRITIDLHCTDDT